MQSWTLVHLPTFRLSVVPKTSRRWSSTAVMGAEWVIDGGEIVMERQI